MKTPDQITTAAMAARKESSAPAAYEVGFFDGAQWMQEQYRWIPVEEEGMLPDLDGDVGRRAAGFSKRVIVLIDEYEHFAIYAYSIGDWLCHTYFGDSTPSYWAYIPPKPDQPCT